MFACLAVLSSAILLSYFCLMYFAFSNGMTDAERKNLSGGFFVWGILSSVGNYFIFSNYGIHAPVYKFILILGWIPYMIVFVAAVRRNFVRHVFVFGMADIWSTILHNFSAIIVVSFFESEREIIFAHAVLYLLFFIFSLPFAKRFFRNLLPPNKFFEDYGNFAAFFPFAMIIPVLLLWSQEPVIHSWQERLSRFYLPIVFFFFYRHILLTTEQLREEKRTRQNVRLMKEQLTALSEYNRLMQESREQVLVMRHDLRHNFRLIYMMLQEGKIDEAKNYIGNEEKWLGKTAVKNFCSQPLINAALSVYIGRAEKLGIKINHKINLPNRISIDERDFAILISNLLENAINASSRQPTSRKKISIVIQSVNGQCVLEISNIYDEQISFDEKNYPQTSTEGHGLGMASIKIFSEKYNAYTDFSQEDGIFKVTMYWQS